MKTRLAMKSLPWLAAFTAVLHTVLGTAEVHTPLLGSTLLPEVRLLLYACWHTVTIILIGSSMVLFLAVYRVRSLPWTVAARFVGAVWVASGFVFIGVALAFAAPAMLLTLGQWILLIPIGCLAIFGRYERGGREVAEAQQGETRQPPLAALSSTSPVDKVGPG